MPLLLPGRLTRAGESPIRDLPELVQLAVEALCGLSLLAHEDIPYFIAGHEFGALVAFEICRRVQAEFPMQGLFVSSMSCPQVCNFYRGTFPAWIHHKAGVACAWGVFSSMYGERGNDGQH